MMRMERTGRNWVVIAAWGTLGALALLMLCNAWQGPDIFYHLFLGKRIAQTSHFQPSDNLIVQQSGYVNLYWLFQLVVYFLFSAGGVVGASLLFIAAWFGTFFFWARTARLNRSPAAGLLLALAALPIFASRFDQRPEVLSYLFLTIQVWWLSSWDFDRKLSWRQLVSIGLVQVLWTNVHGYFILGPVMAGGLLLTSFVGGRKPEAMKEIAKLLGVILVASLISPFGLKTWRFAFTLYAFLGTMRNSIAEFRPPVGIYFKVWVVKLFWVYWAATLATMAWLIFRRRWKPFCFVLAAIGLYLSVTSVRNIPLLLLLSAPIWGELLRGMGETEMGPMAAREEKGATEQAAGTRRRPIALGVTAAVALLAVAGCYWVLTGGFYRSTMSQTSFGIKTPPSAYPIHFAEYLRTNPFRGKVLGDSRNSAYLEYHFPDIRLYMDPRYVDAKIVGEYIAALNDPATFQRLDSRVRFDGVLLSMSDTPGMVGSFMKSPDWIPAYADLFCVFFTRRVGEKPVGRPVFDLYRGEDLSERANGFPAINWVQLAVMMQDRALLMNVLDQYREARKVPSPVILYALQFGLQRRDRGVCDRARALVPAMYALSGKDRETVESLARAAASIR
jgi:hypothetical protein